MSTLTRSSSPNRTPRAAPWGILVFLSLAGFTGCNGGGAAYGPVGYPACTCCCGGYGPVAYAESAKASNAIPAPSSAALFDTKGPMANVSANKSPLEKHAKGHK